MTARDGLPAALLELRSENKDQAYEAALAIRRLLCVDEEGQQDEANSYVIQAGAVPALTEALSHDDDRVKYNAAWALTNIAAGNADATRAVVESGSVPLLVALTTHSDQELGEQALFCLANIAGTSLEYRDLLVASDILPSACALLRAPRGRVGMYRNLMFMLSNICRRKPRPKWEALELGIPGIVRLLRNGDTELLSHSLAVLRCMTDDSDPEHLQLLIDKGICPRVVGLIAYPDRELRLHALVLMGNFCAGTDDHAQAVVGSGLMPQLKTLLRDETRGPLLDTACWVLSNICAGHARQQHEVVRELFPALVTIASGSKTKARREAVIAIANVCRGSNSSNVKAAVSMGAVDALWPSMEDEKVLSAFEGILKAGQKVGRRNAFEELLLERGFVEALAQLRAHTDRSVASRAQWLLSFYFAEYAPGWNPMEHSLARAKKRREVVAVLSLVAHSEHGVLRYPNCEMTRLPIEIVELILE